MQAIETTPGKPYRVHLYAVVRVAVDVPSATSHLDAIAKAEQSVELHKDFRTGEYADEIVNVLVDEIGDDDFLNTRLFEPSDAEPGWAEAAEGPAAPDAQHGVATVTLRQLTLETIRRVLGGHGQLVAEHQIGHYASIEALASKVRSSTHWTMGETFCCALDQGRFVIMKQIAPSSCEMLTITQNGVHDVLTAYRFEQKELVDLLNAAAASQASE